MKSNRYKYIILALILIVLPIFLEFFFSNVWLLLNHVKQENNDIILSENIIQKENVSFNDNEVKLNKKNSYISYDNNQYIQKLKIKFKSKEDFHITISYEGKNGLTLKNFYVRKDIGILYLNINDKISNLKIETQNKNVTLSKISILNKASFNIYRYLYILITTFLILFIINFRKNISNKMHVIFLTVALLIGCLFVIISPKLAYLGWDEAIHYNRTNRILKFNEYKILESDKIITDNQYGLPKTKENSKLINSYINKSNKVVEKLSKDSNFITYNSYVYVPSALVMNLASKLGFSNVIVFVFGKLTNLFIYSFIMYYTIKNAKVGKRLLFTIGLLPTVLFLAVSYSADSIIICMLMLAISTMLNEIVTPNTKISPLSVAIFLFAMAFGSFPKAVYIPLVLMPLFLPKTKFKDEKTCKIFKTCIIAIFILIMATFMINIFFNTSEIGGDSRGGNTSYSGQLRHIIYNPIAFICVIFNDIILKFLPRLLCHSFISFGYLGTINNNIYIIFIVALIFALLSDNSKNKSKFSIGSRIFILILCAAIVFGINLSMYCSFTPVGLNHINGVQARYYLPLMFPILVCLINDKIKVKLSENTSDLIITSLCLSGLLLSGISLLLIPFAL